MKVEYLKSFSKDIDHLKVNTVKKKLVQIIELMEAADTFESVPNFKKLKGHRSAFRIRIGDYRIGFFFEDETITLARIVHRKDIYKIFP